MPHAMDAAGKDGSTDASRPDPAVAAAHHLAASRARRAVEDLSAVLRLAGISDVQERERAHEAFVKAFPISYRLWRDRLNPPPGWPPTRES